MDFLNFANKLIHPFLANFVDCEQSLFLSDSEREARESGKRVQSACERAGMGRAEVRHERAKEERLPAFLFPTHAR